MIARLVKCMWLLCGILIFVDYVVRYNQHEIIELTMVRLLILTFPIGLLCAGAIGYMCAIADTYFHYTFSEVSMLAFLAVLISLGYLQWFYFVPLVYRFFRKGKIDKRAKE